jgi:hypothetical protein
MSRARRLRDSSGLKQSKPEWTKYSRDYSKDNSRNLSRDVSKENIRDKSNISTNKSVSRNKVNDLSKTKSGTKKSSVLDSQSDKYRSGIINTQENDKRIYTNTRITNIPKKTDSKYNKPGYTACITQENQSLITKYQKIVKENKSESKLLKLSDLQNDHSFSKKNNLEITHSSDLQLKSGSRKPIEYKSSTFQSSYSVEDKQFSNKRFESIEEKYFDLVRILPNPSSISFFQ